MLAARKTRELSRDYNRIQKQPPIWHDGNKNTLSFGCNGCSHRGMCGGLYLDKSVFSCLDYCCGDSADCDLVCASNPSVFASRVREVRGFGLDNVARASRPEVPCLPFVVPIVSHGNRRNGVFSVPAICLSLYSVVSRYRRIGDRFGAGDLADQFRIPVNCPLILTGVAKDHLVERWWSLGHRRLETIRKFRSLNVQIVTTPNFSLFTNRPRWDDLHSMKRIAIAHEEFLREGLPAALHLNARTERDWERWTEYIASRKEITHVAFEFTTGAGRKARIEWQLRQLAGLGRNSSQDLHLVVRAAPIGVLGELRRAYGGVTVLDTNAFMKTVHRRIGVNGMDGRVRWLPRPTGRDEPLDALLVHNWEVVRNIYSTSVPCAG